jgi:hypothetical protein
MGAPVSIDAADLLKDTTTREFILLAAKDGCGKTSALISAAAFVEMIFPEARFFVIDTENKFVPTLKTWDGGRVPQNLRLYICKTMNEVNEAYNEIDHIRQPGDWLGIESAARLWERAQDLGYQAITGTMKAAYMEARRAKAAAGEKAPPVTPRPDDLWSIIKGAHDTELIDRICNSDDLNVILTTTVSKVKEQRSNRKENADRVALRAEHGIDLNLDGAPRLPYYVLTLAVLEREGGQVSCSILRDNCSGLDDPRVTFPVPTRKVWFEEFWSATGR